VQGLAIYLELAHLRRPGPRLIPGSINVMTYLIIIDGVGPGICDQSYGLYSFSIRMHVGQTPNCGLPLISSKFSTGQYLHRVEQCQTDVPLVLR
jgi:hypothetical protein